MKNQSLKQIIVGPVNVPAGTPTENITAKARKMLLSSGLKCEIVSSALHKRSIDARKRNDVKYVCSVIFNVNTTEDEDAVKKHGFRLASCDTVEADIGSEIPKGRFLVVGSGPAGLFCALMLAENGYNPLLIERGESIDERVETVKRFYSDGVLSPDCNIQFGAGGAGTFSDGKLVTRISDPKCNYVLRRFAEFGAPEEIKYLAKPHIGTDKLRGVINAMCHRITELGGEIRFGCKFLDFKENRAILSDGDLECAAIVLAIGHSARDTYQTLIKHGMDIRAKAFSCGVRIEHLQEDIDSAMYGSFAGKDGIGHAEYTLSYRRGERGVYTFCMCPGGEVMAAASEEGGVVVNGMSEYARAGKNANSAVAVSVLPSDFGDTPAGAIEFQRQLERAAFAAGGADYSAPCQTVGDFLMGTSGTKASRIQPTYKNGQVKYTSLEKVLPNFVTSMLGEGLSRFDREIRGFAVPDSVLTGVESRTSAPVRIMRGEKYQANGYSFIYPCGEGAGYAGGITSAAVDGINTALAIMKRFKPCEN
jgi:uncharacterized FAD-dependent dehydrogenase